MKILLYGKLADVLGREVELAAAAGCTIAQLRDRIAIDFPQAAELFRSNRVRACVGDSFVDDGYVVQAGEQVEFFPPVSGG